VDECKPLLQGPPPVAAADQTVLSALSQALVRPAPNYIHGNILSDEGEVC